jgi:hypothetical protein
MRNLKRFENYIKENLELETKDDEINPEGLVSDNSFEDDQVPEEEEYDYIGNKLMNDLAKTLGTKVVNNEINYNGEKINFYSETEKFHIGKRKFDTLEDVLKYLKTEVEPELEEIPMESLRSKRFARYKRTK